MSYKNLLLHSKEKSLIALIGNNELYRENILPCQTTSNILAYGFIDSAFFGRFMFHVFTTDARYCRPIKFHAVKEYPITFRLTTKDETWAIFFKYLSNKIFNHLPRDQVKERLEEYTSRIDSDQPKIVNALKEFCDLKRLINIGKHHEPSTS